jgi:transcriptional regulator with XRE-family HTH domain
LTQSGHSWRRADIEDSDVPSSRSIVISQALVSARRAAGYSLEQVAVTSGLTEFEIAQVEDGRDVDERLITRIAKALGIKQITLAPLAA